PACAWWRIHQVVAAGLGIGAAALAWQLKEWIETPLTVALFIALGIGAAINSVFRGHLLFTEAVNRGRLAAERQRAARAIVVVDLTMAGALGADAVVFAAWPLTTVLTLGLAVGIALAATVLEPATTQAAFGGA